jgi:CDP-diacylglycerol---serine O-phosphatidyltransferase
MLKRNTMSKLSTNHQFLDLSDYGRPIAKWIANNLKNTAITPIHVTFGFAISALIAIVCMLNHYYWSAGFFLILKSILDAADGELSRVKNTPSYTGRYLDSNFDIIINLLLLLTICFITEGSWFYTIIAFFGIQLQGTLYNYYYVIVRHKYKGGDKTSRIMEDKTPKAFDNESQTTVNVLFFFYQLFYSVFDKIIYQLDKKAIHVHYFPNWFMSFISIYGLGFQLLIISVMLGIGLISFIIPFFIFYSILLIVFVGIRKRFIR